MKISGPNKRNAVSALGGDDRAAKLVEMLLADGIADTNEPSPTQWQEYIARAEQEAPV